MSYKVHARFRGHYREVSFSQRGIGIRQFHFLQMIQVEKNSANNGN